MHLDGIASIASEILHILGPLPITSPPPIEAIRPIRTLHLTQVSTERFRCRLTDLSCSSSTVEKIERCCQDGFQQLRFACAKNYEHLMTDLAKVVTEERWEDYCISIAAGMTRRFFRETVRLQESVIQRLIEHKASITSGVAEQEATMGGVSGLSKFSDRQLAILSKAFEVRPILNKFEKALLASKTGLTESQVRIWFGNRRQRESHTKKNYKTQLRPPPSRPANSFKLRTVSDSSINSTESTESNDSLFSSTSHDTGYSSDGEDSGITTSAGTTPPTFPLFNFDDYLLREVVATPERMDENGNDGDESSTEWLSNITFDLSDGPPLTPSIFINLGLPVPNELAFATHQRHSSLDQTLLPSFHSSPSPCPSTSNDYEQSEVNFAPSSIFLNSQGDPDPLFYDSSIGTSHSTPITNIGSPSTYSESTLFSDAEAFYHHHRPTQSIGDALLSPESGVGGGRRGPIYGRIEFDEASLEFYKSLNFGVDLRSVVVPFGGDVGGVDEAGASGSGEAEAVAEEMDMS